MVTIRTGSGVVKDYVFSGGKMTFTNLAMSNFRRRTGAAKLRSMPKSTLTLRPPIRTWQCYYSDKSYHPIGRPLQRWLVLLLYRFQPV